MKTDTIIERLERIESLLRAQQPKPFNFNEAQQYLDLSASHLYKLTSNGEIKFYKPNGKKIYFVKSDLDEWLLRNPRKTNSEIDHEAIDHVCGKSSRENKRTPTSPTNRGGRKK